MLSLVAPSFAPFILLAALASAQSSASKPPELSLVIPLPNISALSTPVPTALTSTVYYCTCGPSVITADSKPTNVPIPIVRKFVLFMHFSSC
jgi:hypothetical protein